MGCVARASPAVLLHTNLLLMLYAGAALATAARLKWDPSAYVAARELFPAEYGAAVAALLLLAGALLLLAQLPLAALRSCRSTRRALLMLYAAAMLAAAWGELAFGAWAAWRVARWARGPQAAELRQALALRDHVRPLLQHLAHFHPLPEKVAQIMREAEADLPRNLHVLLWAAGLLLALQVLAAVLALLAAADRSATPAPLSSVREDVEKKPLRAVYRNGRLVMV